MKNKIKQGDICIYHYADGNGSVNIVEVVEVIDSDISKIKCVQVICDKSGNGFFEYLFKTGHTMNASNEYLHKIEQINILTDQLNSAINEQETLQKYVAEKDKEIERLYKTLDYRAEKITELQAENERLKNAYKQCAYERDVFLRENPVEMALLIDEQAEQIKTAKAEAYKEFAERLKKELFYKCGDMNYTETCDLRRLLNNLLKEMVGESNAN